MRTTRAQWWLRIGIVCYTSQITKFIQYRQTKSYAYTQHLIYAFSANSIIFYCISYTSTQTLTHIYKGIHGHTHIPEHILTPIYWYTHTYIHIHEHIHTHNHMYMLFSILVSLNSPMGACRWLRDFLCGNICCQYIYHCNVTLQHYIATGFYYR